MNSLILILICAFLLSGIGIWFAYRFYKRRLLKSLQEKIIPNELMEIFNQAEQMMKGGIKEDGTTKNPHKILWELSKEHRKREGETDTKVIGTEQTTDDRELSEQPIGRQDIQDRITPRISEDKPIVRKYKPNNFRRVISRIRRRKS